MKSPLILLMTLFGTLSHAQPVYRCVDPLGSVAFGGLPCGVPAQGRDDTQLQAAELALQRPSKLWASAGAPITLISQANHELLKQRDRRVGADLDTRKSVVRRIRKPLDERAAAGFAESRRRCEGALRVAELCGKDAGKFSCGDRGFLPSPSMADRPARRVPVDNRDSLKMSRCALQASPGGGR